MKGSENEKLTEFENQNAVTYAKNYILRNTPGESIAKLLPRCGGEVMETCKKCETMKNHIKRLIERNREGHVYAEKMISRYETMKQINKEEYARLQIMLEMCEEKDE